MSRFLLLLTLLVVGCKRDELPAAETTEPVRGPLLDVPSVPPPRLVTVRTRSEALAAGVEYLLAQQAKDGAWRSDVYATFKDGPALTPLVVTALQEARDAGIRTAAIDAAIKKGCE